MVDAAQLERTKKYLRDRYGINTYEDLVEAMKNVPPLDIGIFTSPVETLKKREEKEWDMQLQE